MAEWKIDITKAVEEIIEKLNAEGYTEPELAAKVRQMQETIQRLESENYNLTEKLEEIGTAFNKQVSLVGWHEEREKEYKRLLKEALHDIIYLMRYHDPCEVCALLDDEGECHSDGDDCEKNYKWRYNEEAEKLIGGEDG